MFDSLDEESFHVENTSFATAHISSVLNTTASNTDHFNNSGIQNVDDMSFTMRSGSRQSFDMNFSNLMASDQSMVLMLKEAFQCYLKKDEVSIRWEGVIVYDKFIIRLTNVFDSFLA